MSNLLRPEEIEWFRCVGLYLAEREAQDPAFSASATMEAFRAGFFADVRYDELIQMDAELWRLFNNTEIPKSARPDELGILVLSWLAVTFRNAHSSFLLAQNGFRDTSAANSRVALEHSIYLSLLARGEEGDQIVKRMEGRFLSYLHDITDNPINSNPDMDEFLRIASEDLPIADPGSRSWSDIVEQVCNRLDTGEVVYSRYRILSKMMHVGFASTEPFVYHLKYDPSPNFNWSPVINPANTTAFMAVASCVWAAWSIDHLLHKTYFGDLLDPIAQRLRIHRLFKFQ